MEEDAGVVHSGKDHDLPSARITLEWIMEERMELYRAVLPQGDNIPISVLPSQIDDSVPTEEDFNWAVWRIWGQQLGGPYWIHAEHLQEWL